MTRLLMTLIALVVTAAGVVIVRPDGSTPAPTAAAPRSVPQLLWMTPGQARDGLDDRGLEAERVSDERCDVPPGRVTRTTPAAGEPAPTSGVVRVQVAVTPPAARCAYRDSDRLALRLLDLARFDTHPPRFAADVEVHVDGRLVRTVTRAQAREPGLWGDPSPLTWLAAETALPEVVDVAAWEVRGGRVICDRDELARDLRSRPSVQVQLLPEIPATASWASCSAVRVFRDDRGRVDAVALTGSEQSVAELIID